MPYFLFVSFGTRHIIRKFCLSVLKLVEIIHPKLSMKKKRFAIAHNTEKYLESVLNF